ncbi:MAG: ABC transporter permease, partial [Acidobacteriaceae bacterium]|nr:ABC transporter permease [Acidobacteriaceae bacterium]
MLVVLTISVGLGSAIALFSVTHAVLLRPLPYRDPSRLVVAYADFKKRSQQSSVFTTANYLDLRSTTTGIFEELAGFYTGEQTLPAADGSMEAVTYGLASPNIFRILGVRILLGRDFSDSDGRPHTLLAATSQRSQQGTAALPVMAILSYEYWQRRYGGDRAILGRDIRGPGKSGQQIIGVLAPGFQLLFPPSDVVRENPDVWVVNRMSYRDSDLYPAWLRLIGRLKPGITLEHAQAEADSISAAMRSRDRRMESGGFTTRLEPMQSNLVRAVRPRILVLLGGALLLMLIACTNVSGLMLAQAASRQRELAVQAALGAGGVGIVRRLFLEALLICSAGAVLGVAFAWAAIRALPVVAPENVPRIASAGLDPMVLLAAILLTLVCASLCSLAPALVLTKLELMQVLRGSGRSQGLAAGQAFRGALVTGEVALGFVLLIALGLMIRSFVELQRIDPGFDSHHLLTFEIISEPYPLPQRVHFRDQLLQRLRALPGVDAVTVAGSPPLSTGGRLEHRWGFELMRSDATKSHPALFQIIGPNYFQTFRTPLLAGRTFQPSDDPERVVIIDAAIASRYFPQRPPVGQFIYVALGSRPPIPVQIVGVAGSQRVLSLADPGAGQLFFADGYNGYSGEHWAIRTSSDPTKLATAARAEVARLDRSVAVVHIEPMDAVMSRAQSNTRFALFLIGCFAIVAALLVAIGLYGVLSTVVRQR